jgi:hypothetical protein
VLDTVWAPALAFVAEPLVTEPLGIKWDATSNDCSLSLPGDVLVLGALCAGAFAGGAGLRGEGMLGRVVVLSLLSIGVWIVVASLHDHGYG